MNSNVYAAESEINYNKDWFDSVPCGYTFDDLLLVPGYSKMKSRSEISIKSELAPELVYDIPLMASCMTSVTEHRMIWAMLKAGGTAILHRFMTSDKISISGLFLVSGSCFN